MPQPASAGEDVWGQTQRDRVYVAVRAGGNKDVWCNHIIHTHRYNAIVYVPYQLERLLLFGFCTCIVSLTSVLVVLPLRVVAEWMSFAMHVLRKGGVHVPANQVRWYSVWGVVSGAVL